MTNAVQLRDLWQRGPVPINIAHIGARPGTDIAPLLNTAIANNGGSPVLIPPGVYQVGSLVDVRANTVVYLEAPVLLQLVGTGGFQLRRAAGLSGSCFGLPSATEYAAMLEANVAGITAIQVAAGAVGSVIENIGISGNNRSVAGGTALSLSGAGINRVVARNLAIHQWDGAGIDINGANDCHLTDLLMSNVGRQAGGLASLRLRGSSNAHQFSNVMIDTPYYAGIDDACVGANGGGYNHFSNLKIDINAPVVGRAVGNICLLVSGTPNQEQVCNFLFRAEPESPGTGTGISVPGVANGLHLTGGSVFRLPSGAEPVDGIGIDVVNLATVKASNLTIQGFTTGLRDANTASLNAYGPVRFVQCTAEVNFPTIAQLVLRDRGQSTQGWDTYRVWTNWATWERLALVWDAVQALLVTQNTGGGTAPRNLTVGTDGVAELHLRTNSTNRWYVSSAGHILADADNQYDLGANGASRPRNFYNSGILAHQGASLGFYNIGPIARQVLATGVAHTVDDVITALQALGLVSQV